MITAILPPVPVHAVTTWIEYESESVTGDVPVLVEFFKTSATQPWKGLNVMAPNPVIATTRNTSTFICVLLSFFFSLLGWGVHLAHRSLACQTGHGKYALCFPILPHRT